MFLELNPIHIERGRKSGKRYAQIPEKLDYANLGSTL